MFVHFNVSEYLLSIKAVTVTCAVLSSHNVYQKLMCNFSKQNLISTQATSVQGSDFGTV